MTARGTAVPKRALAGLVSLLLTAGSMALLTPGVARADSAPLDPANPTTPTTVSADPLPTVQIDGVAWSQVVVGNTVYVAGSFTRARPAGAPAGTSESVRNNLLAYDIRTGALIDSFAPNLNAQALAVTASPNGSRIYVGGDFSQVDGQTRYRMAAFDTATGALVSNFRPSVNGRVRAIAATATTVYFGGNVMAVGPNSRTRLAAVSATNGALLPWAPVPGVGPTSGNRDGNTKTSNEVLALVVTGGGSQVVAAGRFDSLNGVKATGVGALDPITGQTRLFAINQLITNQGVNSAINSLSTDGATVYGTGYDFFGPGNLEGSFAAAADSGAVRWINDCRGDTYSTTAAGGALYMSGHPHNCANIGGFPEQSPRVNKFATAVSLAPAGVVGPATLRNANFAGQPAPALLPWFPTLAPGTVTGQSQAGWTVSSDGEYVVYGGEFPRVNGTPQEGLVRFALPSSAPNKVAPLSGELAPVTGSPAAGLVRLSWTASSDQDNEHLTYRVYRDSDAAAPVYQVIQASTWWKKPQMGFTDSGVPAGAHRYLVTATDAFGNRATSPWVSVNVAAGAPAPRIYSGTVKADGATGYWPLGEPSSGTALDHAGTSDLQVGKGVTAGVAGAVTGDANTAYRFGGNSNGLLATKTAMPAPNTFTVEAWFQTTTKNGGKIVGFGTSASGGSSTYDRHVYMDTAGRVHFGVLAGARRTVNGPAAYNDGRWHHVAASLSASGMALYVDGALVGSRADTTSGQSYNGYLRVGGDRTWAGAEYFSGSIDEVALYPVALTADRVANHHSVGSTGKVLNLAPTAAFTSSTEDLTVSVDGSGSTDLDGALASYAWDFGDRTTGTGATASHTYTAGGTYTVRLTVTDDRGGNATTTEPVTVVANQAPVASFTAAVANLTATVDGSTSADADGSVASHVWDFGDGSTETGATASHTYTAAGTYTVRLTVTDDDGAAGTAERAVTVTAAAPPLASDAFERTVTSGFGTADIGGPWTSSGPSGSTSVSGGAAHLHLNTAGGSAAALLNSVVVRDVGMRVGLSLDRAPTGGGTYVYLSTRRVGTNVYRLAVRFLADGKVTLGLWRTASGVETSLRTVTLPGTYTPGTVLQVRVDVAGLETTTLQAKAWVAGTTEPTNWQINATDTTEVLRNAGGTGLSAFLSGSATVTGIRVDIDDLWVGAAGDTPPAG